MDTFPFEIFTSKNRRLQWSEGTPYNWLQRRIPGAASYHLEVKNKCRIIYELIPSYSGMCWIGHYLVDQDLSLQYRSDGDYFMLFLVVNGKAEYVSKAQAAVASAWQLNIIRAPAIRHQLHLSKDKGLEVINFFIPFRVVKAYEHTFPVLVQALLGSRDEREVTFLRWNVDDDGRLREMVEPWWTRGLSAQNRESAMEKFVFNAFDQLDIAMMADKVNVDAHLEALKKVRAHLLEGIFKMHPPPLVMMSKMAGMHWKMLERIFKGYFGKTMLQFFNQARMEAIYRRLCCTTKSLQEIAAEFSYEEYANFSAAVKRRFDQTPSQIRKSARNQ